MSGASARTLPRELPAALPVGLTLYRLATRLAGVFAGGVLNRRAVRGKEDPARLLERLGHASAARPEGPLVWLHGASVGETLMLLPLIDALRAARPDAAMLVTSGTTTSAALMVQRLPTGAIHQYVPIDRPDAAARFVAHWRPDLAVFAESELWPNLILAAEAAGARLALVNARLSEASLERWASWPRSAGRLLGAFSWIGPADARTAEGLSGLIGRPVPPVGNLKAAAEAPGADDGALDQLKTAIGDRPVWLAASTHEGEDAIVLEAHARLRAETGADALLILAPRHPDRGPAIAAEARAAGFATARRGAEEPLDAQTAVYVADTLGEMGLWYRLAPITFVAGSLLPGHAGHNPLEPALLESAILTGPRVSSFAGVYQELFDADAAAVAQNAGELVDQIRQLEGQLRLARVRSARAVATGGANVLETVTRELTPLLPGPTHA